MAKFTQTLVYSFGNVVVEYEYDEYSFKLSDNIILRINGLIVGKKITIQNATTLKSISLIARTAEIYVDIVSILSVGIINLKIVIDEEEKTIETPYISKGKSFPGDYPATKVYYAIAQGDTAIKSFQMLINNRYGMILQGVGYQTNRMTAGLQTITIANNMPSRVQLKPYSETFDPNKADYISTSNPTINIEIKTECMRDSNSIAVFYENCHGERTVIVGQKVSHNHSRESQEYKRFSRSYKNLTATAAHKQIQTIDLVFVTDDPKRVRDLFLNSTVTLSNNDGDITASIVDSEIDLAKAGQMEEYRITFKILG